MIILDCFSQWPNGPSDTIFAKIKVGAPKTNYKAVGSNAEYEIPRVNMSKAPVHHLYHKLMRKGNAEFTEVQGLEGTSKDQSPTTLPKQALYSKSYR